jgi:carboxyl-terminal processing protease
MAVKRSRSTAGRLPNRFRTWLLGSLWAAAALAALPAPAAADLRCEQIPELIDAFLKYHVQHRRRTDEIEARTIDSYLKRLDPSRTLFLQGEIDAMKGSMGDIFEEIEAGNCERLLAANASMLAHQKANTEKVRKTVGADDFVLDESVTWILDPEERGYPKTEIDRDALLHSRIHFQFSNYLLAGESEAEARRRLVRRYELRDKHLRDVEPKELFAQFVDSFAVSLDPHSSYLSAEVLEDFRINMSLSLEGIGVALSERDGYAVAERIIPGGAADRHAVLQPKDKIIAVAEDGGEFVDIIDMPLRDSVSLIRGKKGTKVGLTVLREGENTERFSVTIVRDKIDLSDYAAKLRFEEHQVGDRKLKLAILDLPSFYGDPDPGKRQSTNDVAKLLRQVNEEKADGLLLDLSRNGGGLLPHAVTISGFFIKEGEVVSIENSRGQQQMQVDRDSRVLYAGPMVVHTSRASASASEILAGALKDYKRAVIAGDDHTFGKGTVQTVAEYPTGGAEGALKVTTQLFFRPGGRSTQHDGVEADVVIPSLLSGDDFGEASQLYSLKNQQVAPFLGSRANGETASAHWRPVSRAVVAELVKRSQERIASSEEFTEVQEKLAKARGNGGVVRLEEVLKERSEAKSKEAQNGADSADTPEGTSTDEAEEDPPSPQLEEAVRVLIDLVALTS